METSAGKELLARSLHEWRLADRSFEEAGVERARAEAMMRQLRAREIAERVSWAERAIPFSLRARALECGLWSAEELDAIRVLGARRAEALRSCAPYLPGAVISRALSEIEGCIDERVLPSESATRPATRAEDHAPPPRAETPEARLGRLLFGLKNAGAILTDRGFEPVLDFAEHHAAGDKLALVMEFGVRVRARG
ncbi:hypothetical protein WMF04_28750 [Sorangium sp. So ce260]|uniref:hypothetical protein n=1 Tax=Sorangium sp. So ce260 TaxID=3133291 RepID=UPI003F638B3E